VLIYKDELSIADRIKKNSSFSYVVKVNKAKKPPTLDSSIAKLGINIDTPKSEDLFYTRSVLVSTVWNLNDDIFLPCETWAARNTPIDKPTNIGHNQEDIIGHITSAWAIDVDGNVIDNNIVVEDLPDFFHICNGSVIYQHWRDEEKQAKAEKLINDIENDNMFVSMECFFPNFDYGARKGDEFIIIPRNETSAFLTKKLKIYDGSGNHDGYEIGRILRNLTFCGKGYVEQPANPDSVIFENGKISQFSFANANISGVYTLSKRENEDMLDDVLKGQIDELKSSLANLTETNKRLQESLADKNIKVLEDQVASLTGDLTTSKTDIVNLTAKLKEANDAKSCMCDQYEELKTQKDDLATKLAELEDKQRLTDRLAAFIKKGYSEVDAKVKVDQFKDVSDDNFELFAKILPDVTVTKSDKVFVTDEADDSEAEEAEEVEIEPKDGKLAPEKSEAKVQNVPEVHADDKKSALMSSVASYFGDKFNVKKENKEGDK